MTSLGIDHATLSQDFLYKKQRFANGVVCDPIEKTKQASGYANGQYASGISDAGLFANKCTDGADDGQIGGVSKFLNACEGVLGMGKNLIQNAIKHPFITLAGAAACCIPFIGPAIGFTVGAYGIYNGVKQIQYASEVADSATTDAEAKAAWENIGSSAATVGLSALAVKGSAGVLKGNIKAGIQSYKAGGFKQLASDTANQAMSNIGKLFSKPFNQVKKVYNDIKNAGNGKLSLEGISNYAKNQWGKAKTKVTDKADELGGKLDKKVATKKANKQNLERLQKGVGKEGSNITHKGGKYYELLDDGTMVEYNFKGAEISRTTSSVGAKVGDVSKTVKYANGKTVTENITYGANGSRTIKTETTYNGTTTTKAQVINNKGEVVSNKSYSITKNNGQTVINKEIGKKSAKSVKNENGTGYKKTIDGKTNYWIDGKQVQDPTFIDKLQVKLDTSNSKILDFQIPSLGDNTNPFLMGTGVLEWIEEMNK